MVKLDARWQDNGVATPPPADNGLSHVAQASRPCFTTGASGETPVLPTGALGQDRLMSRRPIGASFLQWLAHAKNRHAITRAGHCDVPAVGSKIDALRNHRKPQDRPVDACSFV